MLLCLVEHRTVQKIFKDAKAKIDAKPKKYELVLLCDASRGWGRRRTAANSCRHAAAKRALSTVHL